MEEGSGKRSMFDPYLLRLAWIESFKKLDLRTRLQNPVMLMVEIGSLLTVVFFVYALFRRTTEPLWFTGFISVWLWLTVLFSNFAEALSEMRGKARAQSLRQTRQEIRAKRLRKPDYIEKYEVVSSDQLEKGNYVFVEAGEVIPADGEVVSGAALVDESAVTGESAPVIRESGGDRSAVTGGTKVIANQIVVMVTTEQGQSFLDKMILLIEGAKRKKTPNEIALAALLLALTIVFLFVVISLIPLSVYSSVVTGRTSSVTITTVVALFVCLAPTTIAALLPAIGIAGMDRLFQSNVIALSGRAIEAAGDVNVLLLDKTGTITIGNREAVEFIPISAYSEHEVAEAAFYASIADDTPEGRSIVVLARNKHQLRVRELPPIARYIPFTAQTRMSGVDFDNSYYRKGSSDSIIDFVKLKGGSSSPELENIVATISKSGGTPLVVSHNNSIVGVIYLKDILKYGIRERFLQLRKIGIKTVMITGDNPLTAAAIAAEAGVDDFLAQATPEDKLEYIRNYQKQGYMIAMTGDGTNDAPALAQADVAVAMNTGTQSAREAANIIDLDSNPTKLINIVEIGKQILMTRGTLTTFSISNDIAKYFAIIPASLSSLYPQLNIFNIMHLANPYSAILSAVIFNALIIPALIPLALKGVRSHSMAASDLLTYNLFVYGLGGIVTPFICIKIIDLIINII
ncbi:MAG: K(+)-transporting ATPase subunit B [Candidatus Margulisiibacteriota bacterium]|nr:MAG: potassium-transporting ATPase subunit B [Candidatus Margulisbacteria bacterium GWD2_39_127]OGI11223.1 MAG: potassium-transporting ATPase subunit B [Candidatus Margulisbacteria bacterium GWE2_39_32]PZM78562.1 MAG: K(+)-transporting ATPase subunit B [Candidatus Margulisiibacteriota bacterium]HAR63871.1 K(+)-transporting ATPase subunit B [Candidatus Margulisiibacteriota bacterium]HCY37678.1 K(+)-transporting ATPase subunit B [Candidatus Margulisiibacteriota bacterium]